MNQLARVLACTLVLSTAAAVACGDASVKLPTPSASVLKQCEDIATQIALCSHGTLHTSPNDGINCGIAITEGGTQCVAAFDNFAACVTGNTCDPLNQGSCRVDYSATTGYCGGFLSPKAQPYIGVITTR